MSNLDNEVKIKKTSSEEKLLSYAERIKNFLNSNVSVYFFIGFFTIVASIQILVDGLTGNLESNSKELTLDLIIWFGSINAIFSIIYSARLKSKFFIFATISLLCWIWRSILTGLTLNALKLIILFFPTILRFIKWKSGEINNKKVHVQRTKPRYLMLTIVIMILLILGMGYLTFTLDKQEIINENLPYIDGANFIFSLSGSIFTAFGFMEGWLFVVAALLMVVTSYIMLAVKDFAPLNVSGIISAVTFMVLNVGTIVTWLAIYHATHNTFKYQK